MRRGEVKKGSATALVTGGNSGIGRCYARRLADLGYNIIIAGLNEERTRQTVEELKRDFDVEIRSLTIDLARPEAGRELFEQVTADGTRIDVLINNAGTFSYLDVLRTPVERIERILCLHVMTNTLTCRLFGEQMAERGHGYILNMSSYSLWMPWPGLSLYSASKSYLRSFSVAFSKEMQERGVRVTSVCPAGVATDLYGLSPRWQRIGTRIGVLITPDSCARRALKAMWRGRRNSVPGWWNRLGIPFCVGMPMCILHIARKLTMQFQK